MDMASAMQELHTHPLGAVLSHSHICVSQDPDQKDQPQSFIPRHAIFGYRVAKLVGGFNPSEKYLSMGRIIPYISVYIYIMEKKNVFQTTKQKIKRTCSIIILTVRTVSQSGHHESNHEHVGVGKTLAESMLVKHVLSQTTRPNRSTQVNHTVPLPYWQTEGFQNKLAHISYTVSSKNLFMTSSFNILTQMVIWKML